MSSLHTLQLLTIAAKLAREEHESVSKTEITKKLQDIKYLSSQKKVPRLSLRKEIIHLENQLQGMLGLEERFARQKDKESIAVASLKQQIAVLKNKLRAVEDLDLDKKVDHLSFLLGEHLAKREIAGEVAMTETTLSEEAPSYFLEEKHEASMDTARKAAMLQMRLEALKHELEIHRALETKKPKEMQEIERMITLLEEKLQQYYEQHPEALLQEVGAVNVPDKFEVKHKILFPQAGLKDEETKEEISEEVNAAERLLPLPPPPRMRKRE
ncbi:MAG: hypothetical protein Q8R47_03660 [Nanoarchaeota archaeon]|nr:hypothetical protein [Nanoarchaeota archaeon]